MHSKKKIMYSICLCSLIILSYLNMRHLTDEQIAPHQNNTLGEDVVHTGSSYVSSDAEPSVVNQNGEVDAADQVARYVENFITSYHDTYPGSYPVVSGQLSLFGNSWSCVMWDGERSEVILIYYNDQTRSVEEKSIVITKDIFQNVGS